MLREMTRRATRYWRVVGRLRDGVSKEAAESELKSIAVNCPAFIQRQQQLVGTDTSVRSLVGPRHHRALWILMGAVAFVIVIALRQRGRC
jgi:hypothetical protein